MRVAVVSPPGQRVALQCRLRAHILLERIEPVKRIVLPKFLIAVAGVLIDLHRSWRERNVVAAAVWKRDERCHICANRARDKRRALRRGEYRAVLQNALMLSQTLVAEEEEGMIAPY